MKITNRTVDALATVDFKGIIEVDATCTAGTFIFAGIGEVINNSTGVCVVDASRVMQGQKINKIYADVMHKAERSVDGTHVTVYEEDQTTICYEHKITEGRIRVPV